VCLAVSLAGMCLGELVINPHQQHMDAFYWVMDWEGMISVSSLVGLLEKHFFPKWLQVSSVVQEGPQCPLLSSHRIASAQLLREPVGDVEIKALAHLGHRLAPDSPGNC
jgi:hypothetical protein